MSDQTDSVPLLYMIMILWDFIIFIQRYNVDIREIEVIGFIENSIFSSIGIDPVCIKEAL